MTDGARSDQIEAIYRRSAPRIRATLIRLLGSFDLAEEALHDAFLAASQSWERTGLPKNPESWLISAGRFRTIDRIRRRGLEDRYADDLTHLIALEAYEEEEVELIADDMLRLIFTCCHPALSPDARAAMALREVCGLTTEEIARAFLTLPATIAQRIVRAKGKIREQRIAYAVPESTELAGRRETVLAVIYLLFNEGHLRAGVSERLSDEAIRLGRLLVDMMPDPECHGLLALMLFQQSRRLSRLNDEGDLVLIKDQDRSLWDRAMIADGEDLLARIRTGGEIGSYGLQAAIAGCHARAQNPAETDWRQILSIYDLLLEASAGPVVALNRAVAQAEVDGPAPALATVERLMADPAMQRYAPLYSVRADLLRRLGRMEDARQSYCIALDFSTQPHELRFLRARLADLA